MRLLRNDRYGLTTLELRGPDSDLQIKFLCQLGKRERRTFIRGFLTQIRPWLHYFYEPIIDHTGKGRVREKPVGRWRVNTFQSSPVGTLPGALGYGIRKKRMELGLTQAQLAAMLEIQRTHLSEIERGIHLPNSRTRQRIVTVLEIKM